MQSSEENQRDRTLSPGENQRARKQKQGEELAVPFARQPQAPPARGRKRRGMIAAAIARLDSLMAIGESRRLAKDSAQAHGEQLFSFSTGKIHSYQTRTSYQQQVLQFLNWVRQTSGLSYLEEVEDRREALVSAYLTHRIESGTSPWTLALIRSAARLFFSDRTLGAGVVLPPRRREQIKRSRLEVAQDQHIQLAHFELLIAFLSACGLRRAEVSRLRMGDIEQQEDGQVRVVVRRGKGGKSRRVPVVRGEEQAVNRVIAGRENQPEERVFARIPSHLDVHHYRRLYAQALYRELAGCDLPALGPGERIRKEAYNLVAVRQVSEALGHHRTEVVLTHYLN